MDELPAGSTGSRPLLTPGPKVTAEMLVRSSFDTDTEKLSRLSSNVLLSEKRRSR